MYRRIFPVINDSIFTITSKMKESTRMVLVFLCCLLLEAIFFFNIGYFENPRYTMLYGSVLTIIVALLCVGKESTQVVYNKWVIIPMAAFSIGVIVISADHNIGSGYVVNAIDYLIIFPILYYVVTNSDNTKAIYKMLAFSAVIEGIIAYLICGILSFRGELVVYGNRIAGHTSNPNFLGALGLLMFMSILYLLFDKKNPVIVDIISSFCLGASLFFMIASSSRAALLSAMGCLLASVVFGIKRYMINKKESLNKKRIAIIIVTVAISLSFGMSMNDINQHFVTRNSGKTQQEVQGTASNEAEELQRRLSTDKDLNTFTSGRTNIWKIYIENFSLKGKEISEIADQFQIAEWRAHNNIIDYCYRCGYIVGGIYALFYIIVGVAGLRLLFGRRYTSAEQFYVVEAIGCYSLYALVEIATLTFIRCVPFVFAFLLSGVACKKTITEDR